MISHLTLLGVEVKGDGGLLFALAVTIFVCGLVLAVLHRREIPVVGALLET